MDTYHSKHIHIVFWIMTLCSYMVGAYQNSEEDTASIIGADILNIKSVGTMILWNEVSTYISTMPYCFPCDHSLKDECCYFCLCDVVQVEVIEEDIHN